MQEKVSPEEGVLTQANNTFDLGLEDVFTKNKKKNKKGKLTAWGKTKKILSVLGDILLILLAVFCCGIGLSSFIFKSNKLPPTFAGYSLLEIGSTSMEADGFEVGDMVVVRMVDPRTLNVGDNIAYYVYEESYEEFMFADSKIVEKETTPHDYSISFLEFFGARNDEVVKAAKEDSKFVFHKITKIYEDKEGQWWFQTKGSSNPGEDYWQIAENMVVGVYEESPASGIVTGMLEILSGNIIALIIVVAPVIVFAIIFLIQSIKKVYIAKLEIDCLNGARAITDAPCEKYDVGYNMREEDKYKILESAPIPMRNRYIYLLWKDDVPKKVRTCKIKKDMRLKNISRIPSAFMRISKEGYSQKSKKNYFGTRL